ncbi:MAG TPA: hypothetical protein VKG61_13135, partial [Streptosporangiaceae bacterium]|nr:hypothetical protein [Streptosporangiaceae bacterium]
MVVSMISAATALSFRLPFCDVSRRIPKAAAELIWRWPMTIPRAWSIMARVASVCSSWSSTVACFA